MGPEAATWKVVDGKQLGVFGIDDMATSSVSGQQDSGGGNMMLNAELSVATNSLRNVTVTKATLLQSWNNFSVPLGVSINCLPHNEVCDTGERYTFTTIPNMGVQSPTCLYETGEVQNQAAEWRRCYSKFNANNLETEDVLPVPNCSWVFVDKAHPVINLLRVNKHLVGFDIDDMPLMDSRYHKVTNTLMQTSCDTLRTKILSRISTQVHFFPCFFVPKCTARLPRMLCG